VGVEERDNEKIKNQKFKFELLQNYPNPFHHSTTIRYQIPLPLLTSFNKGGKGDSPNVKLTIYDIAGRLVETLVDEIKEPGFYQIHLDGKDYASGIYYYRIQTPKFTSTKKLILLR